MGSYPPCSSSIHHVEGDSHEQLYPSSGSGRCGVGIVGVAARVPKLIFYGSQLDTIVHHGCPRLVRRWGVHRGLTVLLCCPSSSY